MTKFLKESFRNGNRYTNIGISIIVILIGIIGFFLRDIYSDFKEVKTLLHKHDVTIEVLQVELKNHKERGIQ